MATIIKLTYTITGKTTLVNMEKVSTAFRIFERGTRKYATRINFDSDSYIIVDEELQEIKKLVENNEEGNFQSNDWVELDSGEGSEDFHTRLEENYNRTYQPQQQRGGYQKRPYNKFQNERW